MFYNHSESQVWHVCLLNLWRCALRSPWPPFRWRPELRKLLAWRASIRFPRRFSSLSRIRSSSTSWLKTEKTKTFWILFSVTFCIRWEKWNYQSTSVVILNCYKILNIPRIILNKVDFRKKTELKRVESSSNYWKKQQAQKKNRELKFFPKISIKYLVGWVKNKIVLLQMIYFFNEK